MAKTFLLASSGEGTTFYSGVTRSIACIGVLYPTGLVVGNITIRQDGVTFSNLKTYVRQNSINNLTTVTLRKNSIDTSVTVTYTFYETGEKEDTSNTSIANSGDEFDYTIVPLAAGGNITFNTFALTLDYDSESTLSFISSYGNQAAFNVESSTRYVCGGEMSGATSVEASASIRISRIYNIDNLEGYVTINGRTTACVVRTRINAVNGNQSITWNSGQTGRKSDTLNTDLVVALNDFNYSVTLGALTGLFYVQNITTTFYNNDTRSKYFLAICAKSVGEDLGQTVYNTLSGEFGAFNLIEQRARSQTSFDCTATSLSSYVDSNTSTVTATTSLRLTGVTSAMSISYAAAQTGLKTDTDEVLITGELDYLSIQSVEASMSANVISFCNIYVEIFTGKDWISGGSVLVIEG